MTFPDYESIDYKQGLKVKMTVEEIENRIKIMKELLYPIDRSIEFTVETLEKKWKQDAIRRYDGDPLYSNVMSYNLLVMFKKQKEQLKI